MATAYDAEPLDPQADGGAMSEEALVSYLNEHEQRAVGYFDSEIASQQEDALNRYYRRPYGDEQAGRSKVVDATVAITVDNALASILKPFVSSDDTVAFEPKGKEDEEVAKQATEYVNYVLHNDNCGFLILHDWFKDALLQKLGVVKVYWEDYKTSKAVRLEGLDPLQLEAIMAEEEVIGGPYGPDEFDLYALDILKVEKDGKLCVENVPPEEYRISPYARPGRTPPYEAHITPKTRSELIEMGFEPHVVEALSAIGNDQLEDMRAQARYQDETWDSGRLSQPGDKSRDLLQFNHEYVLIDYDGDGISELREVMRVGEVVLYNEEVEEGCFARLCPVPMPHKIYGQSVADQVIDEQRIATVLWRQTLDNLYLSNNPRPQVSLASERTDGSTYDDLLDDSPGALIRVGSEPIVPFAVPFVADKSFPMLDYVAQQSEMRTGISKQGQGMDPEALDKSGQITATQAAIMEDGRNARAELIARIFAETGVKELFKKMLRLLVKHQPRARMIRLRNEWVDMDPRSWNADMDMSISVGLGMGNKAQQIAIADGIIETIAVAKQDPMASGLFPLEQIYNAIKNKFRAAGIKNTDEFIKEPDRDEEGNVVEPDSMPDPEMVKAQAEMAVERMKLDMKREADMAERERKVQEGLLKIQLENQKAENQQRLAEQKAAYEASLAEREFRFEQQMALREQAFEERMAATNAARDMDRKDRETDGKLSKNRPGGKLDE